jgi:maltose/maltodextrin transport system permease protein
MGLRVMLLGPFFIGGIILRGFLKIFLWLLLAIVNGILFWGGVYLIQNSYYELGVIIISALLLIDFFIFNPKAYPYRYTIPALIFLFLLVLYPIYFTIKVAFTNYGTGHIFTRQEALERILYDPNYTYVVDKKPINFKVFAVYKDFKPTDDFVILFDINNEIYIGTIPVPVRQRGREIFLREGKLYKLSASRIDINGNVYEFIPETSFSKIEKIITTNKVYEPLYSLNDNNLEKNSYYFTLLIQKFLSTAEYITPEGKIIGVKIDEDGRWKFFTIERLYRLTYENGIENGKNVTKMVIINTKTNKPLIEEEGSFYDVDENGNRIFLVGYTAYVGFKNFSRIFTDERISGPFFKIFIWTVEWSLFTVLFSFSIGLAFALVLNNRRLKGRNIYRTLLIIPWAIPYFISVLTWKNGIFNETYGILNKIILPFLGLNPIKWFNDPFWAKVICIVVNTWLTFPYMMTISLGALQSIPDDLYEAAAIDGAGKISRFRYVTFPLLLSIIAPLLISSFAYTFNNFTLIYLLNGGGPPMVGSTTPAGHTDILISYVYKLAFEGRGQEFGFASAISILIFFLVAGISLVNFKISGAFEEVRGE